MANHALLFGISQFSRGLPPLPAAAQDVPQLAAALHPRFQVSAHRPTLHHTDLIHNLRRWTEARRTDDRLLVYFSTHAIAANGRLYFAAANTRLVDRWDQLPYHIPYHRQYSQPMQATLGNSAILPFWETTPQDSGAADWISQTDCTSQNVPGRRVWDGLYLTAVPLDIVKDALDACRAAEQLVILDCCITTLDPVDQSGQSSSWVGWVNLCDQLAGDRRVVLAASHSSEQYLPFQKSGELSVYTRYLAEGIRTGMPDTNDNQHISISELHQYVQERVHLHTPLVQPQQRGLHRPMSDYDWFEMTAPAAELIYRRFVQQLLTPGRLPDSIEQMTLQGRRTQWRLPSAIADQIEDEVQHPSLRRRDSLQRYKAAVEYALQQGHTLTDARSLLDILRQHLGLRLEDIDPIQQRVVSEHERAIARQQHIDQYRQQLHDVSVYAQVVQRSLQGGYPIAANLRPTLDRIKTLFQLPNHRLDQLEAELMSPVEAEQQSYQSRLQFYGQLFAEAVTLDVHRDAEVRDRFNYLRHSLNLAAIDVGQLEQAVIQRCHSSQHSPTHPHTPSETTDPGIPPSSSDRANNRTGDSSPASAAATPDTRRSPTHEFDYPNPIQPASPAPFPHSPAPSTNGHTDSQNSHTQDTEGDRRPHPSAATGSDAPQAPAAPPPASSETDLPDSSRPFDANHPNYQTFLDYENALTQAVQEALPIAQSARPRLNQLRDRLGLSESEAGNIEAWVIARAKAEEDDYQRRCRQYEGELTTALTAQESLGIRTDDLPLLWRQALTQFQTRLSRTVPSHEMQPMIGDMYQILNGPEATDGSSPEPSEPSEPSEPTQPSEPSGQKQTDGTDASTEPAMPSANAAPTSDSPSRATAEFDAAGGLDQLPAIMPVSSPLISSRRLDDFPADLEMLEQSLTDQDWKTADRQTFDIMLKLTRRETDKWLDASAINSLQLQNLRGLSQMWAQHSRGKFGFEVQRQVFQSVMGQHKKPHLRAIAFARQVGWWSKSLQVFKFYNQLDFNINSLEQARRGHFPAYWFWKLPPLESILSGGFGTGRGMCDTDQGILQELMVRLGVSESY